MGALKSMANPFMTVAQSSNPLDMALQVCADGISKGVAWPDCEMYSGFTSGIRSLTSSP